MAHSLYSEIRLDSARCDVSVEETKAMERIITKRLKELQAERQQRIDLALRNGYRPGFTRDGRVCLVKKEEYNGDNI